MKPRLTEAQWLAAKRIVALDLYRSAWNALRKYRLFGAACCRRAMTIAPDPRFDQLADAAEQFADGRLNWNQVKIIRKALAAVRKELGDDIFGPDEAKHDVVEALEAATGPKPLGA